MYEAAVRADVDLSSGQISVVDFHWPADHRWRDSNPCHRIGLSLSPVPQASRGRFNVAGCSSTPIGKLVFVPSDIELEASNAGGFQRVAALHFKPDAFHRITDHSHRWSVDQLGRSTDLRSETAAPIMVRMAQEALQPGFGSMAVLESLMTVLAVDVSRYLTSDRPDDVSVKGGLPDWKRAALEERIRAEDMPIPSVSDLAALSGLSVRHLLRCYRQSAGETLRGRLQQESLTRALTWLRTTDLPVSTIAERLGFVHPGSFSTAFKAMVGTSPAHYRRKGERARNTAALFRSRPR